MTDRRHDHMHVAHPGIDPLEARWAALGNRTSAPAPPGAAGALLDRLLVYLRPAKAATVLPHLDRHRSGMIFAGATPGKGMRVLAEVGADVPRMIDPACYETYMASCKAPFQLPEGRLIPASLDAVLDEQIEAGATAALTPTGFIPAGGTDILRAAAKQFKELGRDDAIFEAPLDISLLADRYIRQTTAILDDLGLAVAIVLGGQFDPLDQSRRIIPNLRNLAATVPLMPIRTDFNAFDLVSHGAFAGAIGTGGSIRHTVDPTETRRAYSRDPSPSVLFPELACWFKGSKINELFGARPYIAPQCHCPVCGGQRLTRFLRREDQNEAIAHAVAVWSQWAADLLDGQKTMRDRAQYWRNLCKGAVDAHTMFLIQLQRMDGLDPQKALKLWAALPAWPTETRPVSI